jgi:hypothetical protein
MVQVVSYWRPTDGIGDTPRMMIRVSLALMLLMQACRCGEVLDQAEGSILGQVCYADDVGTHRRGDPYAGPVRATRDDGVVLDNVDTRADGSFSFVNVQDGNYRVFIDDGEYARELNAALNVNGAAALVFELPGRDPTNFDDACATPPADAIGCVSGTICNRHTGEVTGRLPITLSVGGESVSNNSNEDGTFRICADRSGQGLLEIGNPYNRAFAVTLSDTTDATILDLADGRCASDANPLYGNISGFLCEPGTTDPLTQGTITVEGPEGGAEPQEITEPIDAAGTFFFSGLEPGRYDVRSSGSFQTRVVVVANETASVTDTVNCGNVTPVGQVVGSSCAFDSAVELVDGAGNVVSTTTSSPTGAFSFADVLPGLYTLRIRGAAGTRVVGPFEVVAYQATSPINEPADDCIPTEQCMPFTLDPREVSDGRILLVIDRSGSMGRPEPNIPGKWDFTVDAIDRLLIGDASRPPLAPSVDVGLMLYPAVPEGGRICTVGSVIETLESSNRQTIMNALNGTTPAGGTPTAATIRAARDVVAAALQGEGANRPLAVVLATDGAPNCQCEPQSDNGADVCYNPHTTCNCSQIEPNPDPERAQVDGNCSPALCLDDTATYTALQSITALNVPTYVIGTSVGAFAQVMNGMATAGGTARAGDTQYYPVERANELDAVLNEITSRILSCSLNVPGDGALSGPNVVMTVSLGGQEIPRDVSHTNGWDFAGNGTRTIEIHGPACDRVNASNDNVEVLRCERQ